MAQKARHIGTTPQNKSSFVFSALEFDTILRSERARVDRSGNRFSLIALEVERYLGAEKELNRFLYALRSRLRNTDQLGWLDNRTIGILLPNTELEGAWVFVVKFERDYFGHKPPAPFTVYCYPEHWLKNGNGSGMRDRNQDLSQRINGNGNERSFKMISRKMEHALVGDLPRWKRVLDVTGSLLALILSSPLFLILSAYIKLVSPGPVFFKQERVGYRGQKFCFVKFRTMDIDNNSRSHRMYLKELIASDKPMEKLDESKDPRIIFGGRVIRKACLDELPQLINVLKGEMSLVGPRPCLPYEAAEYLRWHTHRFDILPGLTGLWQVSGKNSLTFKNMIRLDISYSRNVSIGLDMKILLMTMPAIIGFIIEAIMNKVKRSVEAQSTRTDSEQLAICQVLENFAERS